MSNITSAEKVEMLKETIYQLYSKEGRSKSYISKLLNINRATIAKKIIEWKFPEAEPRHHIMPSTRKFINKNRNLIKSRLDNDIPITKIADELKISRYQLQRTIIPNDEVLKTAHKDYINRIQNRAEENRNSAMNKSRMDYDIVDYPNEQWKPILGYPGYMVSDYARIKHYSKSYKTYHLVKTYPNKNNGRIYVMLYKDNKKKNIQVANLVAHAFVGGYDEQHNTVNHEDGNVANNKAINLTWQSQSENNRHAYQKLNRQKNRGKRYEFSKILYKNKYEFKTIAAFSRFIGKSETQVRRYIDNAEKYDIKLIK